MHHPAANPNIIVASLATAPNNLDPRVATDDTSQKIGELIFDNLMELDEQLRVVPFLAESLTQKDATTYVARLRRGVRFHDGHELTSADVVYTFRCFLDPQFTSARKTVFRSLQSIEAGDRYTVVFSLKEPFASFPSSLIMPVVPDAAGLQLSFHPVGTGPYRFGRYVVDDHLDLEAFSDYFRGRPKNDGVILRIVPDEVMRGLELRKGTIDLVVNDMSPDIVAELESNEQLKVMTSPGSDYQYIGLNLRDPAFADRRVRQALAHAIDREAIVKHLRRGLAVPAIGPLPPVSWAFTPDVFAFAYDRARARALLDEAGYRDPGGDAPATRLHLTLKASNGDFSRLQSAVIQQELGAVGIALDVRMYEFATLYADVLSGNFQMFALQWTGGALADPDILRQIFHSSQAPPAGFNRGRFSDPRVDRLLDEATVSTDEGARRELFSAVQRLLAVEVPYVSLWYKTNFAVAQRTLTGVRLSPTADLRFLQDVARVRRGPAN